MHNEYIDADADADYDDDQKRWQRSSVKALRVTLRYVSFR